MSRKKYKWEDVGYREYLEVTTESLQYHYTEHAQWLRSAGRPIGGYPKPWAGEIKINGLWQFVGEFRTGREAKVATITAYEAETTQ